MMKAVLLDEFGPADNLYIGSVPIPEINDNQVLIRVRAASVNRPDIVQRQGHYPAPKGDSPILGLEAAGEIVKTGKNAAQWQPGDRAFALVGGGGYAEYVVAETSHVMPIPDNMSFEQAACIAETYITAWLNIFQLGGLSEGDTVLLHGGGGGVNTAAIQLCNALLSDCTVVVTASSGKIERVEGLGADYVIDYQNDSFLERMKNLKGGLKANVVLDHIGSDYFQDNLKVLDVMGRLVIIGVMSGVKAEVNLALLMVKRQQIIGSVLRSRSIEEKASIIQAFSEKVLPLFQSETIQPLISSVHPLAEVTEAHQLMESGQHFGKIVLTM